MRKIVKYVLVLAVLLGGAETAGLACGFAGEADPAVMQDKEKKKKNKEAKQETGQAAEQAAQSGQGQPKGEKLSPKQFRSQMMQYIVEGEDTIYIGQTLPAARIYEKLARQKGKDWRKFYRLVYNFSKVYPYAIVARSILADVDSTITTDGLRRGKKEKYIDKMQDELFNAFEKPLKNLTINQGALLMRLIDREVGKSAYDILKDYKSGMTAGFWQGIAKLFGMNMKDPYDPEGVDFETEELIKIWEAGEFEGLYFSLFGQFPVMPEIPDKYK